MIVTLSLDRITGTPCHPACDRNVPSSVAVCTGIRADECHRCASFSALINLAPTCVDTCPTWTFGNWELRQCEQCSPACANGCTGPLGSDCKPFADRPENQNYVFIAHELRLFQPTSPISLSNASLLVLASTVGVALQELVGDTCALTRVENAAARAQYPPGVLLKYRCEATQAEVNATTRRMGDSIGGTTCTTQPHERTCLLGILGNSMDGLFNAPTQVVAESAVTVVAYRTPCADGWVFDQGVCVIRCPNEHFVSPWGLCEPCNGLCTECTSAALSDCNPRSCKHASRDGQCVLSCNTTQEFFDSGSRTCETCSEECDVRGLQVGCTGPSPSDCVACKNYAINGTCSVACPEGYVVLQGVCIRSGCPTSHYLDEDNTCQKCHGLCHECSGSTVSDCVTCKYVRDTNGMCATQCDQEMFVDEGIVAQQEVHQTYL